MQVPKKIYFRSYLNYIRYTMESTSVSPEGNTNKNRGVVIILTILIGLLSALSGYLYFQMNTLKADSAKLRSLQPTQNIRFVVIVVSKVFSPARARLQTLALGDKTTYNNDG